MLIVVNSGFHRFYSMDQVSFHNVCVTSYKMHYDCLFVCRRRVLTKARAPFLCSLYLYCNIMFINWISAEAVMWLLLGSCFCVTDEFIFSISPCSEWFKRNCNALVTWTHRRSHCFMIAHTLGDFIVLQHCWIRSVSPWPNIPLRHIILMLSKPVLAMTSTMLGNEKSINW